MRNDSPPEQGGLFFGLLTPTGDVKRPGPCENRRSIQFVDDKSTGNAGRAATGGIPGRSAGVPAWMCCGMYQVPCENHAQSAWRRARLSCTRASSRAFDFARLVLHRAVCTRQARTPAVHGCGVSAGCLRLPADVAGARRDPPVTSPCTLAEGAGDSTLRRRRAVPRIRGVRYRGSGSNSFETFDDLIARASFPASFSRVK
jgi:hypothetical protein